MLENLLLSLRQFIQKIGEGTYTIGYVFLHSIGVKKITQNCWNYEGFLLAVWVFVLGLPLGAILFGTGFFASLWAGIVLALLIAINFDETMNVLYRIKKYGITTISNNPV